MYVADLLEEGSYKQQREASQLRWTLVWNPQVWSCLLLIYWGYIDVTMAAILCPTGMVLGPSAALQPDALRPKFRAFGDGICDVPHAPFGCVAGDPCHP